MTLENTAEFYTSNETPDEIIINGQALIPIRTIMRLYKPSSSSLGYLINYYAEDIKRVCRVLKIPLVKPYGIYNIPCINKKFLDGILYLFRNGHVNSYGRLTISYTDKNEAKEDVQRILTMINNEIEQYLISCNHTPTYEDDYDDEESDINYYDSDMYE